MFIKKNKSQKQYCSLCRKRIKEGDKIMTDGRIFYHKQCYEREKEFRIWEFLTAMEDD